MKGRRLTELPMELKRFVRTLQPLRYGNEETILIEKLSYPIFQPRLEALERLGEQQHHEWPAIDVIRWKDMLVIWDGNHRYLISRIRQLQAVRVRQILLAGEKVPEVGAPDGSQPPPIPTAIPLPVETHDEDELEDDS